MSEDERCLDGFHSTECPGCGEARAEPRAEGLDVLNARIEWEDVLDGLEVALSYPAEMEVNRERWRAARINLLAALAAIEGSTE